MAVHLFKSTDTGAPTLSGTAGDLTNLLDKLLVDGYNAHTTGLSITRSGSTATVAKTAHNYITGQRILNAGWDQTEYNVGATITRIDANSYSYTVTGTPVTPGTGTGTSKVAPLGWTTAYTATNKRAYRMPAGTNQFYLRVVDEGTTSAAYGRMVGYEVMSDIDTGTGAFPTAAQVSGGLWVHKSSTANATTRAWWAYSDGKSFFLINEHSSATTWNNCAFGDFVSFVGGDSHNTFIVSAPTTLAPSNLVFTITITAATPAASGWYTARLAAGTGTAIPCGPVPPGMAAGLIGRGSGPGTDLTYPMVHGGGLGMQRALMYDGDNNGGHRGPRGYIPSLWAMAHSYLNFAAGDTLSGAVGSTLEGRTFEFRHFGDSSGTRGGTFFETSDTWRT